MLMTDLIKIRYTYSLKKDKMYLFSKKKLKQFNALISTIEYCHLTQYKY